MKRFRELVSVETIADDTTGKKYVGLVDSDFIDLINELAEENEQLKIDKQNWYQQDSKIRVKLHQLKEENEQLKQQLQSILKLTKKIEDCTHDIKMIGDVE